MKQSLMAGCARRKPQLLIGYDLYVTYQNWSTSHQHLWLTKHPWELWEAVTSDAAVYSARLERRKRTIASFNRILERALNAPLNKSNQGFSLMR